MDLSAIYADSTEVRGAPPFDPRLMLKIVIYGYSHGVTSSRALERRCNDDVAFGLLTAQQSGPRSDQPVAVPARDGVR